MSVSISSVLETANSMAMPLQLVGTFAPLSRPTRKGGLLVFVAAEEGKGKLKIVGWYKDATFEPEYEPRPEYATDPEFDQDVNGEDLV